MKNSIYLLTLCILTISCNQLSGSADKVPFIEQETGPGLINEAVVPEAEGATDISITDQPIKIQRKLIWTADLEFQVRDVDASTQKITELSEKFGGFISDMELTSNNFQISNQITVRVSNDKFHAFVNAIKGESIFIDRANISSNDVTEEFVDIESRLKTKREVRERYIDILRNKTGDISDVLEAEEAIRKITEEIEAKEGRLRYLKDRVDHSSVVMTIYEKVDFVNQPTRYEKGYGEEMTDSFSKGWNVITSFFLGLITVWPLLLFFAILYWQRKAIIRLFSGK